MCPGPQVPGTIPGKFASDLVVRASPVREPSASNIKCVLCKNNPLPSSSLSLSHVSGNCKSSPGKEEDKTAEGVGKVKVRGKRKYTSADNRGGETKKKKLSARSVSCSCCFGRGPCRLPALLIIEHRLPLKEFHIRVLAAKITGPAFGSTGSGPRLPHGSLAT
jgi:hypothetical protein